jgi:hypothetical protein
VSCCDLLPVYSLKIQNSDVSLRSGMMICKCFINMSYRISLLSHSLLNDRTNGTISARDCPAISVTPLGASLSLSSQALFAVSCSAW